MAARNHVAGMVNAPLTRHRVPSEQGEGMAALSNIRYALVHTTKEAMDDAVD
jgi:hypothetical protein